MLPSGRRRKNGRCTWWRSCAAAPLSRLLFFSWETELLNRPLFNWGVCYSRYLKLWFSLGAVFGAVLMVTTAVLMLGWFSHLLPSMNSDEGANEPARESTQFLTIVIPGISVPWSHFPFMILATVFAVAFHEFGHAMAAASERVPIEHVALFMAGIIPGALVALDEESLQSLSPFRALRIYCAGVWHNVMCCAGCYMLLVLLPAVLSPFYVQSQHPKVLNIDPRSPLAQHLSVGDSISAVAGIPLLSPKDWSESFQKISLQEKLLGCADNRGIGMEISSNLIKYITQRGFLVCSQNLTSHGKRVLGPVCPHDMLPFYEHPWNEGIVPVIINSTQYLLCLKAKDVLSCPACCMKPNSHQASACSKENPCLFPVLGCGEELVDIKVQHADCSSVKTVNGTCQGSILFVGDPGELQNSMQLTQYWPRPWWFSGIFAMPTWRRFPEYFEILLSYINSLSAAMALLNSAPVFYLDGEHIFGGLVSFGKSVIRPKKQKRVVHMVLATGSSLLALLITSECMRMIFG